MAELAAVLPNGYEYLELESSPESCQIRVKNISCAEDVNAWLDNYSDVTMTTWRVATTHPRVGKVNVYRKEFRCQHRTDRRRRGQRSRSSKNTNCPAKIEVVIRRIVPYSRAKDAEQFTEFPARVIFRRNHNHTTSEPAALKHRDMSIETREKLISLFLAGHGASSARNYLKMELLVNDRENCDKRLNDTRYIPSTSVVSKLRKVVIGELDDCAALSVAAATCSKVTARELRTMLGKVPTSKRRPARQRPSKRRCLEVRPKLSDTESPAGRESVVDSMPATSVTKHDCDISQLTDTVSCEMSQSFPVGEVAGEMVEEEKLVDVECELGRRSSVCSSAVNDEALLSVEGCLKFIDNLCERIKQGVVSQPEVYVPVVSTMHLCLAEYPATDGGLAALYKMGTTK